jgi:PAS domain S-box-containing protein
MSEVPIIARDGATVADGHQPNRAVPPSHSVQFYESEPFLCKAVSRFLAEGLGNGQPVLVIATAQRRAELVDSLVAQGIDCQAERRTGRLTLLDAEEQLASFMVGGEADPQRFRKIIGRVMERSLQGRNGARARVYGETVDVLQRDGNRKAALRVEEFWNDLANAHPFSLLCAYAMDSFRHAEDVAHFHAICGHHDSVLPAESYTPTADEDTRLREISLLQLRASALETEITQRERVEQALRSALADRTLAEAALRRSERELKDFLENAVEGLHWVGPDGTILWANQAELDLMGYTRDEYIGHSIAEFHVDQHVIADILERLAGGQSVREYEAQLRRKDGSIRYVLISSNVLWQDGTFLHTRSFTRDITERKRAEEALRSAKEEVERAYRAKSEFLAVMSHELRTPLNAIMGYQDLLAEEVSGPVTREQRAHLAGIKKGAEQLLELIDHVLRLSRIESGKEVLTTSQVDIVEVARKCCALVEPMVKRKRLAFEVRVPDTPLLCTSDAGKVRQIVLNLLSNAVKFTELGSIVVEVRVAHDVASLEVSDTGLGIQANDQDRIFDPFVQVDASSTRRYCGTGLGLPVSRDLARLLGGDLTVASTLGRGSTFTLTIPVI